ncbi:MAG: esterase/lipase family protein [Nitrososphaera sp.]
MLGEWIRKPKNGISVVFVHGILSSGETCWRHDNGAYWPHLLRDEPELEALGIYVYTYQTGIFSGTYNLKDVVDDLKERLLTMDKVVDNHRIVFVCHSMGGIVVRKFLVERVNDLLDRNIEVGLFLVASPSMGSSYANWLKPIAELMGHSQADALRFSQNNTWLNGLDKEFQNLKESDRLKMHGKELIEDKFVILPRFWRKQVVEPFAGKANLFSARPVKHR